jgi:hypothetical protein
LSNGVVQEREVFAAACEESSRFEIGLILRLSIQATTIYSGLAEN